MLRKRTLRAARAASVRKTLRRGVTEAWVTGTHAEHRQTKASE